MLNAYRFEFKGAALGGVAVVVAGNEETARKQFTTLVGDEAVLVETKPFKTPMCVYYDTGDY